MNTEQKVSMISYHNTVYRNAHQGSVMSFISGLEKASMTTLGKAFFKPFSKKYVFRYIKFEKIAFLKGFFSRNKSYSHF